MKKRDIRVHLYDAHEACQRIVRFTSGKTLPDYAADELLRSAVERQFTILGEALSRASAIDATLGARILDLGNIIAFRNHLVHNYAAVDASIVWGIVTGDVPAVRQVLRELLESGRDP